MTPEELFAAYPQIPHAASFVELFLCQPSERDPESVWDYILKLPFTPDQVIGVCKEECEETARERPGQERFALARAEMDHPQFATYVRGKMGAM